MRTIEDSTGLTVSSVAINQTLDWESQIVFAIATSHLHKLLEKEFEGWQIDIGENIKLNKNNLLERLEEAGSKSFLTKKDEEECILQVHHQMCLEVLRKNLEPSIKLEPIPFKLKSGKTIKGQVKLLLAQAAK